MTKSAFWRAGALTLVAVLVLPTIVPGLALATEAKHTSLNGSLLHPTSAELNAFAHKGKDMEFVELTTGQYPSSSSNGSARLLFGIGDKFALHMQANDNALPFRGVDYMWGGTSTSSLFGDVADELLGESISLPQVLDFDFIGGRDADLAWSSGVSLAQAKEQLTDSADDAANPENFDGSLTGFAVRGSVGNEQFDAGWEFGKVSLSVEVPGADPAVDKFEASATVIGAYGQFHPGDWTFIGALAIQSSDDGLEATSDEDPGSMSLFGAAGHHFRNDDDGHVTGQFHFEYMKTKDVFVEISSDGFFAAGDGEITDLYVPGCEIAIDHMVSDRFRIYLAADASYVLNKAELVRDADDSTVELKTRDFFFDWTAGLGFAAFNNVQIDAVFNTSNLDQILSLGNDDPFFAQFSANVGI